MQQLCESVHSYAGEAGAWFRTISVKIRFDNFETHTRAHSLKNASCDLSALKKTAWQLLSSYFSGKKVRLIGVRVSGLQPAQGQMLLADYIV